MLNLIAWLIVGALSGGIAGMIMRDQHGHVMNNIITGINGAMLGGLLVGKPIINQPTFDLNTLVISCIGAILLLGVVNLVRHGLVVSR